MDLWVFVYGSAECCKRIKLGSLLTKFFYRKVELCHKYRSIFIAMWLILLQEEQNFWKVWSNWNRMQLTNCFSDRFSSSRNVQSRILQRSSRNSLGAVRQGSKIHPDMFWARRAKKNYCSRTAQTSLFRVSAFFDNEIIFTIFNHCVSQK